MPFKPRRFSSGLIFSLSPILPDLEQEVKAAHTELDLLDFEVKEEDLIAAWSMYQLERHAHLALEFNTQKEITSFIISLIGKRFFDSQAPARDLLLSQVLPVLSLNGEVPYTERICRVWTRLPDLHLQFL